MKTIIVEKQVGACEICGKELGQMSKPLMVQNLEDKSKEPESYYFHQKCADNLLIKTAKKLFPKE